MARGEAPQALEIRVLAPVMIDEIRSNTSMIQYPSRKSSGESSKYYDRKWWGKKEDSRMRSSFCPFLFSFLFFLHWTLQLCSRVEVSLAVQETVTIVFTKIFLCLTTKPTSRLGAAASASRCGDDRVASFSWPRQAIPCCTIRVVEGERRRTRQAPRGVTAGLAKEVQSGRYGTARC